MNKRHFAFLLCFVLVCSLFLPLKLKAYADPFTASQIAGTAYAMMQSWGIGFTAGTLSSSTVMQNFMTNEVESYAQSQGSSIADLFVGSIAVDVAGKLVVGHTMYNSIKNFVDWLKDTFGLTSSDTDLIQGKYNNTLLPYSKVSTTVEGVGYEVVFDTWLPARHDPQRPQDDRNAGWRYCKLYSGGQLLSQLSILWDQYLFSGSFVITKEVSGSSNAIVLYVYTIPWNTGISSPVRYQITTYQGNLPDSLSWNGSDYIEPVILNPGKEWIGDIDGYSAPDTNLDQLIGDVFDAVADNNLVVDGEVIDVPVPPTPVPTIEPGDIDGYWNRQADQMEGLSEDIGDISGQLDGIGEQVGDIADQVTAAAEGVQDISDALEDETINWTKFDLRGIFPFCIPFDIYNMLEALEASPTAPHVQLPFVIESIGFSYTIDLDFSAFDTVAAIMRQMELIVYGIALAWATSKVIKW